MLKKINALLIIINILFFYGIIQAQNYLPFQIGNRWEFKNYYQYGNDSIQEKDPSTVIVKMDSTMPNGKTYFFLDGQGAYISGWVRTDTSWLYLYDRSDSTEYPFINFDLQSGDTLRNEKIIGFITLAKKDTINLFNSYTTRLIFEQWIGFDNIMSVSFSDKYGFLGESYYYFGTIDYSQLSGCIIGDSTYGTITKVDRSFTNVVKDYALSQNYPNPFNSYTKIIYSLPASLFVNFSLYDCLGKKIMAIVNERQGPGTYQVEINSGDLPSGIYFYRLIAGTNNKARKMILLK